MTEPKNFVFASDFEPKRHDQLAKKMEGNLWLKDTIGAVPKNAWAINPFSHSLTMAYLLRRMGFNNMLI